MCEKFLNYNWSEWHNFPDPSKGEYLYAPFGLGLYQLRNVKTEEYVLFGKVINCAYRISSLLPKPYGQGTRNNLEKREYLLKNLADIQYRTISFLSKSEMDITEKEIKKYNLHKFNS